MTEIMHRAEKLGATKSEYASLIIQHWYGSGSPAVNSVEERLIKKDAGSSKRAS